MSSDPPSAAPSDANPAETAGPALADDVARLGEPLLDALGKRLPSAPKHAAATSSWALAIAVELGLDRDRCLAIRETARLHDIGKVYAAAGLLAVPETDLDDEGRRRLDAHAEAGFRLAQGAGLPSEACGWLRHTRERYEGGGLPDGLFGGAIPLESRIIRAACAFDVELSRAAGSGSDQPPSNVAIAKLRARTGTELDRGTVEALGSVLQRTTGA